MARITKHIAEAKAALEAKELVAIPTETVYGLAANALDEEAVRKIFVLKQRPSFNPLIIHIHSADELDQVAQDIPPLARVLADSFWPGPLTLVLKKNPLVPDLVTAGKSTVGVRVPNHPLTRSLLAQLAFPLAAPSANPFGSISPTQANHVLNYFPVGLELVLDGGPCDMGIESTIIGFDGNRPVLYRHGSVALEELEAIVGPIALHTHNDASPEAPGMLGKHYAPTTRLMLSDDVASLLPQFPGKKIGVLLFKEALPSAELVVQEVLSTQGSLREAAGNLYSAMHRLDQLKLDLLIAEIFPAWDIGVALNDRLARAAATR